MALLLTINWSSVMSTMPGRNAWDVHEQLMLVMTGFEYHFNFEQGLVTVVQEIFGLTAVYSHNAK
jgi:hypothetical protein